MYAVFSLQFTFPGISVSSSSYWNLSETEDNPGVNNTERREKGQTITKKKNYPEKQN